MPGEYRADKKKKKKKKKKKRKKSKGLKSCYICIYIFHTVNAWFSYPFDTSIQTHPCTDSYAMPMLKPHAYTYILI